MFVILLENKRFSDPSLIQPWFSVQMLLVRVGDSPSSDVEHVVDPQHPLEVQAQADGVIVRHEALEAGVEVGGYTGGGGEPEGGEKMLKHSKKNKLFNLCALSPSYTPYSFHRPFQDNKVYSNP